MRLGKVFGHTLVSALLVSVASWGYAENNKVLNRKNVQSSIDVVLKGGRLIVCIKAVNISADLCFEYERETEYLAIKIVNAIKGIDIDKEIYFNSKEWGELFPFASKNYDGTDFKVRRAKFLNSNDLSKCIEGNCGKVLDASPAAKKSLVDFWNKSFAFITCIENRNRTYGPKYYDFGPSHIYELAKLGKVRDCPATAYPSGLAEIINKVSPQRSY